MRPAALAAWLLPLAGCLGTPPSSPTARDVSGQPIDLTHVAAGRVRVLVFTSHECPIANAYAPTLRDLAAEHRADPIDWQIVHVDPDLTPAAARRHADDFGLPGTIVLEPAQTTARRLGVERTPEVVVLTAGGVAYQGRIDDQWAALGSRRAEPTTRDLAAALTALRRGDAVACPRTPVVGCLLPEPAPAAGR